MSLLLVNPNTNATTTAAACRRAIKEGQAEALVIGGGPLATDARPRPAYCRSR